MLGDNIHGLDLAMSDDEYCDVDGYCHCRGGHGPASELENRWGLGYRDRGMGWDDGCGRLLGRESWGGMAVRGRVGLRSRFLVGDRREWIVRRSQDMVGRAIAGVDMAVEGKNRTEEEHHSHQVRGALLDVVSTGQSGNQVPEEGDDGLDCADCAGVPGAVGTIVAAAVAAAAVGAVELDGRDARTCHVLRMASGKWSGSRRQRTWIRE